MDEGHPLFLVTRVFEVFVHVVGQVAEVHALDVRDPVLHDEVMVNGKRNAGRDRRRRMREVRERRPDREIDRPRIGADGHDVLAREPDGRFEVDAGRRTRETRTTLVVDVARLAPHLLPTRVEEDDVAFLDGVLAHPLRLEGADQMAQRHLVAGRQHLVVVHEPLHVDHDRTRDDRLQLLDAEVVRAVRPVDVGAREPPVVHEVVRIRVARRVEPEVVERVDLRPDLREGRPQSRRGIVVRVAVVRLRGREHERRVRGELVVGIRIDRHPLHELVGQLVHPPLAEVLGALLGLLTRLRVRLASLDVRAGYIGPARRTRSRVVGERIEALDVVVVRVAWPVTPMVRELNLTRLLRRGTDGRLRLLGRFAPDEAERSNGHDGHHERKGSSHSMSPVVTRCLTTLHPMNCRK